MKIAYHSPLPPERSGIADYSALLVPPLARRADLEVVRRRRRQRRRKADVNLYHVGNDPQAHGWIVDALRRRPGVVVLHDFVLHHLIAGVTLGRGDGEGYLAAMHREAGVVGRLLGHGVIDRLVPPLWETRAERFPLAGEVLQHATGVVVHSRFVEAKVREAGYAGPVARVPHPAWPRPDAMPEPGLPAGRGPVVGCFGNLTTSKRIPQLIEAFRALREELPTALLVLAGRPGEGFALEPLLEQSKLAPGEDVVHLDYVDEPRLWALMAAADICVNLRWPTMGETSGTAIRALVLGRPIVVSDIGWFAELPDDVGVKIPVGEPEVEALTQVLLELASDPAARHRLGEAGKAYVEREHDLEVVADRYAAVLEDAAGGEAVRESVAREIAEAAAGIGLAADSPEVGHAAAAAREVGLGD